jgi:hypothetical protein
MSTSLNSVHDFFSIVFLRAVFRPVSCRVACCRTLQLAAVPILGLGLTAPLCAQGASQPPGTSATFQRGREFQIDRASQPFWLGKFLVELEDPESKSPVFELTDHDGHKARVPLELPDTVFIQGLRYSAGADGSIVAIGTALRGKSSGACFIAWISPDRKRQTVIQAYPFVPEALEVAADGTIWSVGTLFDDDRMKTMADNVIRRYDTSGKLLSSLTVTGLRSPREWPGDATMGSALRASRDRIGWFTAGNQYLELSLEGREMERFEGPPGWGAPSRDPSLTYWVDGFALSSENQVVLTAVLAKDENSGRMVVLNRSARTWYPALLTGGDPSERHRLVGFDGVEMITQGVNLRTLVRWTTGTDSSAAH